MDDDERQTDDISELWGADDGGAWEPAPLRPVPPRPASETNGSGHADRLDALEHDLRALVRVVERVEALVNERLSRLEQQVADMTAQLPRQQSRANKGIGRISDVIRSPRTH